METAQPYFRLFACCCPVKGARRSVICDLQRHTFAFIPNGLYEILTLHQDKPVNEIKAVYNHAYDDVIDQYLAFLTEQEYGFWCDDPTLFPDLDLTWQLPEAITNAIIDVDEHSTHDFASILTQLDELGCKAVQFRFYCPCTDNEISQLLEHTRDRRLRTIELLVPYSEALSHRVFERLCHDHQRISRIVVHSAPENRATSIDDLQVSIYYRTHQMDSPSCCGEIHPGYFLVDIELFTEAQQFNTCLNRKLSIDARGEIKNCPSMAYSFGNMAEVALHSALAQPRFKALWTINKDHIEVCKDCEFRYICTDCRAALTDPQDLYSKPSKCTYDPYTAQWCASHRAEHS
jgi:SPASM domain peptide maturase of grasp-with-spasm system